MFLSGSPFTQNLNPLNPELSKAGITVASLGFAVAVIVAIGGTLGLLASLGVSMGPLNVLSVLTTGGSGTLIAVGVIGGGVTFVWFVIKLVRRILPPPASSPRGFFSNLLQGEAGEVPKELKRLQDQMENIILIQYRYQKRQKNKLPYAYNGEEIG